MRRVVWLGPLLFLIACGDDDDPGATGSGDSSGSGSQTSDDGSSSPTDATSDSADASTTTDGSSSSDPGTESTGGPSCSDDLECTDARLPLCVDGNCTTCDAADEPDAACAALGDGSTPLCIEGRCVQCTAEADRLCSGTTPICDDQNTCVGCSDHAQCPDSACRIGEGECFPTDAILHVDGDAPCDGDGSEDDPLCTIADALQTVGPGQTATILVAHTTLPYAEAVEIDNGRTIAILGDPASAPTLSLNSTAPLVRVGGAASSLYLQRMRLQGNLSGSGLEVSDGRAYLDRVEIVSNTGTGVSVDGGHVQLRNTIVGRNGDTFAATRGIDVADGTFTILYGSVIANEGDADDDTLRCDASSSGTVRNSILLGTDLDSIACADVDASWSAVDGSELAGEGVEVLNAFDPDWFVNVPSADFHLDDAPRTPFSEVARWRTGDPAVDLDGDERPLRDDSADYAGADSP